MLPSDLCGRHKVYGCYLPTCSVPQANPTPVRQRRRIIHRAAVWTMFALWFRKDLIPASCI